MIEEILRRRNETPLSVREEIRSARLAVALGLAERLKDHEYLKRNARRKKGETWIYSSGRYKDPLFHPNVHERTMVYNVELEGIELAIFDQVVRIREKKDEKGDETPVVVVDFGGMHGFSMVRLTAAMSSEVTQGRVAFVVTNLGFKPTYQSIARNRLWERDRISWQDVSLFTICRRDVNFVQADAQELLDSFLILPKGWHYPLRGNVDVLHENMVFTHGKVNDVDLPRLGRLLSRYGTFLMGTDHLDRGSSRNSADHELRKQAHAFGVSNLEKMGLEKIDRGARWSRYAIYLMPAAPRF